MQHIFGLVMLIFSYSILAPLVTAFYVHDAAQHAFDKSIIVALLAGLALRMPLLSCITASCGSTGGGLKMIRAVLLFRRGGRELEHQLHPVARLPVKTGSQAMLKQIEFAIQAFVIMYVATIVAVALALLASGLDFIRAFSAVIACINNAGPGFNEVGPGTNYASLNDLQTWALALTMLFGRSQLFTVFVLFTRAFWRG